VTPLLGLSYAEIFHKWRRNDVLLQTTGLPPNPLAIHRMLAPIMLLAEMTMFFSHKKEIHSPAAIQG